MGRKRRSGNKKISNQTFMAYSITEIEKAINSTAGADILYITDKPTEADVNYVTIVDYLNGQSTSLNSLQQTNNTFNWHVLFNLLKNTIDITAKEQLVLDVVLHPVMYPGLEYHFNNWVFQFVTHNTQQKSFEAALQLYKKNGKNNNDFFELIVNGFSEELTHKISIDNTPLKDFLLTHIKHMQQLQYFKNPYASWHNQWSMFYFLLLEEVRQSFASEYALYGMYADYQHPAEFFVSYKQGKYIPVIIEFLTNLQNPNLHTIQLKFAAAMRLYQSNSQQFLSVVLTLSNQYLDYCSIHKPDIKWEQQFQIQLPHNKASMYLPYSAWALYFLLQHQKENGLVKLEQMFQGNAAINTRTLEVLFIVLQQQSFVYFEKAIATTAAAGGLDYFRTVIQLLQSNFEKEKYLPLIWPLASSKSKPIRELVAKVVAEKDDAAETTAIQLLQNKNAETRQTAAVILSYFSSAQAKEAVLKVLDAEANDNARDILLQTVAESFSSANKTFITQTIAAAAARGKLNKPVEAWLNEAELPDLFFTVGEKLTVEEIRFLLYRMSRVKTMRSDAEAKLLLHFINKETAAPFAVALIKMYIDKGAKPELKWLMALAALLGNNEVVDKIRTTINKWIDENRYKMAEHGVGALALQGSDKALRWVEWYSRKYRSKKANVGAAALAALEAAAEELNISTHELGDRIVPDFGFDGLFRSFNAGGEEYRAFIDSNFKIAFFNEDNKKLKAIPPAADALLKEEFKAVAKEVRDVVKAQSPRLEYYLIIQRRWTYAQWQHFFLQNPVMFIYATKLVWGVYDNDGVLTQTFICNDDTSLINEVQEEITVEAGALVGIVHPTQLDAALLQQWKQTLFDNNIEQVFTQLDRAVPDMTGIDVNKGIITKYEGKRMADGSIRSTLERYGWHKGNTGDGGMLESFNLLYYEKQLEAVLELEGVGAGYGWGMEEKTGRLYVIDKTKLTSKWATYVQSETDPKLVPLKNIPAIFLSEMLAAVEKIKPFEVK